MRADRQMEVRPLTALYVLLLGGIVYLAGHPQHHGAFSAIRNVPGGDKVGHFLLAGLFSLLLNTSLGCRAVGPRSRRMLVGSLAVALAVTLEELSQIFLPRRSFDLVDLLFDYLGIWAFGRAALSLTGRRRLSAGGAAESGFQSGVVRGPLAAGARRL